MTTGGTEPVVTAVVVSHNTRDLTLGALSSLLAGTHLPIEVIVVDTASGDGSVEAFHAAALPHVTLRALSVNVGFARAVNLAAGSATGQFLLLLNPDAVVMPGAVDALVAFAAEEPEALIWGGSTTDAEGRPSRPSCANRMTLWSIVCRAVGLSALRPGSPIFDPESGLPAQVGEALRVDIVVGCLLLIKRSTWIELGGFDPAFFVYGEEVDLCLRARRLDARPMTTAGAVIRHIEGASRRSDTERSLQVLSARMRNARLHLPVWQRPVALWIMRLGVLARRVLSSARPTSQGERRRTQWTVIWRRRREWWNGYPDWSSDQPLD